MRVHPYGLVRQRQPVSLLPRVSSSCFFLFLYGYPSPHRTPRSRDVVVWRGRGGDGSARPGRRYPREPGSRPVSTHPSSSYSPSAQKSQTPEEERWGEARAWAQRRFQQRRAAARLQHPPRSTAGRSSCAASLTSGGAARCARAAGYAPSTARQQKLPTKCTTQIGPDKTVYHPRTSQFTTRCPDRPSHNFRGGIPTNKDCPFFLR